jgi:hypothetical protein
MAGLNYHTAGKVAIWGGLISGVGTGYLLTNRLGLGGFVLSLIVSPVTGVASGMFLNKVIPVDETTKPKPQAWTPDLPQGCYVTTVAARGNPAVTGSELTSVNGKIMPISKQLRTFKAAELALADYAPGLHSHIRKIYDKYGSELARHIDPNHATLLHVVLTPLQAVSYACLSALHTDADQQIANTY